MEVLIRVRDVSAEDAANVWNAVRGVREEKDVVFIPGVIRRLRLLDLPLPLPPTHQPPHEPGIYL